MKEYIKLFQIPNDADNYDINDIPWVSAVKSTEQLLYCDEDGKKCVNDSGIIEIVDE